MKPLDKTIAVLPFVNLSDNKDNEYFSDGITEEIINALAKIKQLSVTSRTSSFFFKHKEISIADIGKQLQVSSILEGSVRLHGDMMRITAQLINVAEDAHFWSETWDRKLENVFSIQDEISLIIAEKLREQLGHFEIQEQLVQEKTTSIEAYETCLKARYHYLKWNQKDAELAISLFERAIELDPLFVEAHCGVAGCNIYLTATGIYPPDQGFARAKSIAQLAVKLNDKHPDVYNVLGAISLWYEWDFEQAIIYLDKAFHLQPSDAEIHQAMSMCMMVIGRKETALSHIKIARKLNPLSVNHMFSEAFLYYLQRDHLTALALCETILEIDPHSLTTRIIYGCCLCFENRQNDVIKYFEETTNPNIDVSTKHGMLALAYNLNKDIAERDAQMKLLQAQLSTTHAERAASFMFLVHAAAGETNRALDYFEKAMRAKSPLMLFLFDDPILMPIADNARFKQLIKKTFGKKTNPKIVADITSHKKKSPLLDFETSEAYAANLLKLINQDKPYLTSSFTLKELADLAEIHPNHLSWLLNDHFGKSFNEFINHYRVEAFKQMAIDPKNAHITLIGLAYDCGFNSKTVFNSAFKRETGMTPKQFVRLKQ